ncbi:MAG: hypothetical protein Q7S27_03760 [Nanoarchaeota archaeon]|nr:hypothetical protein [Nanoarchaeota archaeon]
MKNKLLDYIGQLRIYSLIDLILLLYAAGADREELIGGVLLHIGFLAFLESKHRHGYRENVPLWLCLLFIIPGLILYGHIESIGFLAFSFLYALKNGGYFGIFAPLFRGMQYLFLVGGIMGYYTPLIWMIVGIVIVRNLLGDIRDAQKDRVEGLKTLPMILGLKKGFKYIHLAGVLATTLIAWNISDLSWIYLIAIWIIEISTYNLTRR